MNKDNAYTWLQFKIGLFLMLGIAVFIIAPWKLFSQYYSFISLFNILNGLPYTSNHYHGFLNNYASNIFFPKIISPFGIIEIYLFIFLLSGNSKSCKETIDINWSLKTLCSSIKQSWLIFTGRDGRTIFDKKKDIADYVKNAREKNHMTQQHLADILDVNIKTIQRAENNGNISKENLRGICSVLNISLPVLDENTEITLFTILSDFLIINYNKKGLVISYGITSFLAFIIGPCFTSYLYLNKASNGMNQEFNYRMISSIMLFFVSPFFINIILSLPCIFKDYRQKKSFILGGIFSILLIFPFMCLQISLCSFNTDVNNLYKKINTLQTLDIQHFLNMNIEPNNEDDQFLIDSVYRIAYLEVLNVPNNITDQTLSKIEMYSKDTSIEDLDKYYDSTTFSKQKIFKIIDWRIEACHKLRNLKDHDGFKSFNESCSDYDINKQHKQRLLNRIKFLTH